jgi:hypothetical protein
MLRRMRITLSLDQDVAAALERLQGADGPSLDDLVNKVLRRGLRDMTAAPMPHRAFRTKQVSLGTAKLDLTNIHEALAIAERPDNC